VHVEVDRRRDDRQSRDARLLLRLPQGDVGQLTVTVGVPARLEPALDLGVEQEQDVPRGRVDDEGRAREVALGTGPQERIGVAVDEGEDLGARRLVIRAARPRTGDRGARDREVIARTEGARPKAWQSRAGPRQRSRSVRAAGRRARMTSMPVSGSAARRSTATPCPSSPHTALAHQCMP